MVYGSAVASEPCCQVAWWGGLEMGNFAKSLLDGSTNGWWWYAVGATKPYRGKIPGPAGIRVSVVELYLLNTCPSPPSPPACMNEEVAGCPACAQLFLATTSDTCEPVSGVPEAAIARGWPS